MDLGDTGAKQRTLDRLEDVLWVTQAQAGDSDAFARLMCRYEKRLLYYLRRIVPEGDWALDLHQEVWVDAFQGLPSLQIPQAFCVWIYRIAHRKAARFIQSERQHQQAAKLVSESTAPQQAMETKETFAAEAVHHALGLLAPDDREVLVLHYLRDLSTQELAAVLDCPVGTVKSRLYHARIALRRVIERKEL